LPFGDHSHNHSVRFLSLILVLLFSTAPVCTIVNFTRLLTPGTTDIIGAATATNAVTVNGNATDRHGEFFQYPLSVTNGSGPVWQSVAVSVTGTGLPNTGNILIPPSTQSLQYDSDGNLTSDLVWNYTWDAENRLIQMSNTTSVASTARKKLDFAYDYLSRRYQKIVSTWNGSAWTASQTNYFFHDGWLLVAETSPGITTKAYPWGIDLSGLPAWRGGAAGVGGLVAMKYGADSYYPAFDGNGNVMALVGSADGKVKAQYEYGPFAEAIRASGAAADLNPLRFSTKYTDDETGFSYYGYRYYSPSLGHWANRDPFLEAGALNLYNFNNNAPLNFVDETGLAPRVVAITGTYNLATKTGTYDLQFSPDMPSATAIDISRAATPRAEAVRMGMEAMVGYAGSFVAFGVPEPTMATKVAGFAGIAWSSDRLSTAATQFILNENLTPLSVSTFGENGDLALNFFVTSPLAFEQAPKILFSPKCAGIPTRTASPALKEFEVAPFKETTTSGRGLVGGRIDR
jgi:RHS repeat-associated protein